eukprot:scaffold506892_cov17-Prasinocladus_malaysianus.AAC.1
MSNGGSFMRPTLIFKTPITLGIGLIRRSELWSHASMTFCTYHCLMEPLEYIDSAWSIFSSALSADPTLTGPIGGARVSESQTKETPPDAQSLLG